VSQLPWFLSDEKPTPQSIGVAEFAGQYDPAVQAVHAGKVEEEPPAIPEVSVLFTEEYFPAGQS